jgi:homoprotocatechuate degradation regulator HpaR
MQDDPAKDAPKVAEPPGRLAGTLPMLLLRAREAVLEPARPILRRYGLTEAQWRVLRTLEGDGEMEATRLARAVYLRAPSVTRIVRDLAAKAYVSRTPDPRDGRVVLVAITPLGREIVEEVLPLIRAVAAGLRAAYGAEALAALEQELAHLISTAGRAPD